MPGPMSSGSPGEAAGLADCGITTILVGAVLGWLLAVAVVAAWESHSGQVALAKIITEKGAAIDSFYVRYTHGWKIQSKEQQTEVERHLREAIASLG